MKSVVVMEAVIGVEYDVGRLGAACEYSVMSTQLLAVIIGWLSAVIASVHDIKRNKGQRLGSRAFLRKNRTPLILALLATAAAVVGVISTVSEAREATARQIAADAKAASQLETITLLQALALRNSNDIVPVAEIGFRRVPFDSGRFFDEETAWRKTAERLPLAIGFLDRQLRDLFFPGAPVDELSVSTIDVRSHLWRAPLRVLYDGRITSNFAPMQAIIEARVIHGRERGTFGFRFRYQRRHSPLSIWLDIDRLAKSGAPIIVFERSGQAATPSSQLATLPTGWLRYYLTDSEEVFAFAELEPSRDCGSAGSLCWRISGSPKVSPWALPAWAADRARAAREPTAKIGMW